MIEVILNGKEKSRVTAHTYPLKMKKITELQRDRLEITKACLFVEKQTKTVAAPHRDRTCDLAVNSRTL